MFTDERRCNVWNRIRQQDLRVFGRILTPALMKEAAQAAGVKLGNSPLNQANLVWLGIAAALHTAKNFADILVLTFKLLEDADLWKPDGSTSQTEAARLEAQSPRQEGCAGKRGSLRSGATTDADGFLVVADPAVGPTLSGPASRRGAVEGLSPAGIGRHGNRLALLENVGPSLRHQPQRPTATTPSSANGHAGVSAMPAAVALRTDAAIVPRTNLGGPTGRTPGAARLVVDGSRLLELRAVLANPTPTGVFRHPAASRRVAENVESTSGRTIGWWNGKCPKRRGKSARGKPCPACRNR